MSKIRASRYHDISTGHRVVGHENKCRHLHGHNYRIHFHCEAETLDNIGRVIDFGVIKEKLCMWVEEKWDHKFLAWNNDSLIQGVLSAVSTCKTEHTFPDFIDSLVFTDFNPTAENMAEFLVTQIGPMVLFGTGVVLTSVVIEETAKCSASFTLGDS